MKQTDCKPRVNLRQVVIVPSAPEPVLDQMHAAQRLPRVLVAFRGARWSGEPARPLALGVCPQREEGRSRSLPWDSPVESGVAHGPFNVLGRAASKHGVRLVQPVFWGDTLFAFLTGFAADPVKILLIRYPGGPHDISPSLDAIGKTDVHGGQ